MMHLHDIECQYLTWYLQVNAIRDIGSDSLNNLSPLPVVCFSPPGPALDGDLWGVTDRQRVPWEDRRSMPWNHLFEPQYLVIWHHSRTTCMNHVPKIFCRRNRVWRIWKFREINEKGTTNAGMIRDICAFFIPFSWSAVNWTSSRYVDQISRFKTQHNWCLQQVLERKFATLTLDVSISVENYHANYNVKD